MKAKTFLNEIMQILITLLSDVLLKEKHKCPYNMKITDLDKENINFDGGEKNKPVFLNLWKYIYPKFEVNLKVSFPHSLKNTKIIILLSKFKENGNKYLLELKFDSFNIKNYSLKFCVKDYFYYDNACPILTKGNVDILNHTNIMNKILNFNIKLIYNNGKLSVLEEYEAKDDEYENKMFELFNINETVGKKLEADFIYMEFINLTIERLNLIFVKIQLIIKILQVLILIIIIIIFTW